MRLHVRGKGLDRTIELGSHDGALLGLELTACDDQPRGNSLCASATPPKRTLESGWVAEAGVIETYGYTERESARWVLLRTQRDLVLVQRTAPGFGRLDLCATERYEIVAVLQGAGAATVQEAVFVSTPDTPAFTEIDCVQAWGADGRCTG